MKVVHCKHSGCDVYGGRPGPFGNPFRTGVDGTRDEVIKKYEDWLYNSPDAEEVRKLIMELPMDTVIGCWCKPKSCHCDVIKQFRESSLGFDV